MVLGANNLAQINKELNEVFGLNLVMRPKIWAELFTVRTPERKDDKVAIIKLDNTVTETADGGAFTPNNIKEIGSYTITQKIYKDSIPFGDFASAFDNYGKIKQAAGEKGLDYGYKLDLLGADFFNNATSTTAPYGFEVDGSGTNTSLTSATQPVGDTGSTQSNLVTGGWTDSTIDTMLQRYKDMKRHNGNKAGYPLQGARMFVPTSRYFKAWKTLMSPDSAFDANNNKNPYNSLGIELVHWDLMTATDNRAFLVGPKYVTPHFIYMIKEMPSTYLLERSQQTGRPEYQTMMMAMCGVADYQATVCLRD